MRLIDADELIDYFYFGVDDKPIIDGISDRKIIDIIKNQPTAYSVDKVVEELQKMKGLACDGKSCSECEYTSYCLDGEQSEKVAIDKAIEIVKQGGVRKDVE